MTKYFGVSSPSLQWAHFNAALLIGEEGKLTREKVAAELQVLLESCYTFGINPLAALRRAFPNFQWRHWQFANKFDFYPNVIRSMGEEADFIWAVSSREFVTAGYANGRIDLASVFWFNRAGKILRTTLRDSVDLDLIAKCF